MFLEKHPDCAVDVGCWTGLNKSIEHPCVNKDRGCCLFKGAPGDIVEVRFGKPRARGRLECVACYHARAEARGIRLCDGKACRATRAKYGLAQVVGSPSACKTKPVPPRPVAVLKARDQVGLEKLKQIVKEQGRDLERRGRDVESPKKDMKRMKQELRSMQEELSSSRTGVARPFRRSRRAPESQPKRRRSR